MFKTSQYFAKIFVMRNSIENDRVVKALFYFFFWLYYYRYIIIIDDYYCCLLIAL